MAGLYDLFEFEFTRAATSRTHYRAVTFLTRLNAIKLCFEKEGNRDSDSCQTCLQFIEEYLADAEPREKRASRLGCSPFNAPFSNRLLVTLYGNRFMRILVRIAGDKDTFPKRRIRTMRFVEVE